MRNGREGYDLASIAFGYPSERHWLSKGQPMLVRGSAPKTLGCLLYLTANIQHTVDRWNLIAIIANLNFNGFLHFCIIAENN